MLLEGASSSSHIHIILLVTRPSGGSVSPSGYFLFRLRMPSSNCCFSGF